MIVFSFGFPRARLRRAFDRGEPPVPLGGALGQGPGGLVEAAGFDQVQDFAALLAAADQPGPFEHDQVLGDGLAGERDLPGQPAGADLAVADQVAGIRLGPQSRAGGQVSSATSSTS
jgi:hypothetical protein